MASALNDNEDEISTINITPLVDVVLVLLVIFMITAPQLYQNALKVNLPQARSGEDQSKSVLTIVMDAEGSLTVDKKPTTLKDLDARVNGAHPASAIILADRKVEHGKVIGLIDLLKRDGVQKFSFGVEKN